MSGPFASIEAAFDRGSTLILSAYFTRKLIYSTACIRMKDTIIDVHSVCYKTVNVYARRDVKRTYATCSTLLISMLVNILRILNGV